MKKLLLIAVTVCAWAGQPIEGLSTMRNPILTPGEPVNLLSKEPEIMTLGKTNELPKEPWIVKGTNPPWIWSHSTEFSNVPALYYAVDITNQYDSISISSGGSGLSYWEKPLGVTITGGTNYVTNVVWWTDSERKVEIRPSGDFMLVICNGRTNKVDLSGTNAPVEGLKFTPNEAVFWMDIGVKPRFPVEVQK